MYTIEKRGTVAFQLAYFLLCRMDERRMDGWMDGWDEIAGWEKVTCSTHDGTWLTLRFVVCTLQHVCRGRSCHGNSGGWGRCWSHPWSNVCRGGPSGSFAPCPGPRRSCSWFEAGCQGFGQVKRSIIWFSFHTWRYSSSYDRRQAHLAVLNESCTESEYVKLVEALCAEHNINLIKVSDPKKLGEWVGQCKIDRDGNARKVVACSCVAVTDFGEESEAMNVLLDCKSFEFWEGYMLSAYWIIRY